MTSPTPRLFAAASPSLADHRAAYGGRPSPDVTALVAELERAGLTGRGGAGFPTHVKVSAVARQSARHGGAVVVGNGTEGEPLSVKDKTLLARASHLVIDGLLVCADALGARGVHLVVDAGSERAVRAALAEREDAASIEVVVASGGFVGGEASAVVAAVQGRRPVPSDRRVRLAERGVRRAPSLVQNVETLARIALIVRDGGARHREPDVGTRLFSVGGSGIDPRVFEAPGGTSARALLDAAGIPVGAAVLVGGYHGAWVPADAVDVPLASGVLAPGAGVVHALAPGRCGLEATAEILAVLASASAGQCGPCVNGLPRLAMLMRRLAAGDDTRGELRRIAGIVDGRGACHHPDGSVRMLRSALAVFDADASAHVRGTCLSRRVREVVAA